MRGQHGTGDSRCRARCGRRGAKGTFETEADKWKLSPGRLARPPASVPVSPEGAKQQRVVFTSLGRQAEYTAVRPRSSSSFQTQATVEPEGRVTNLTAASWAHAALCPTPRPGVCRSPGPVLGSERTSEALSFLVPVSMTAEGLSPPGHCLGPRILTSEDAGAGECFQTPRCRDISARRLCCHTREAIGGGRCWALGRETKLRAPRRQGPRGTPSAA